MLGLLQPRAFWHVNCVVSLHPEKHLCEAFVIVAPSLSCVRGSAHQGDNAHHFPYLNIDGQKAFLLLLSLLSYLSQAVMFLSA